MKFSSLILPPPYTIGEANIADTDVSGKVKFIGFMSPKIISIEEKALQTVKRQLNLTPARLSSCKLAVQRQPNLCSLTSQLGRPKYCLQTITSSFQKEL